MTPSEKDHCTAGVGGGGSGVSLSMRSQLSQGRVTLTLSLLSALSLFSPCARLLASLPHPPPAARAAPSAAPPLLSGGGQHPSRTTVAASSSSGARLEERCACRTGYPSRIWKHTLPLERGGRPTCPHPVRSEGVRPRGARRTRLDVPSARLRVAALSAASGGSLLGGRGVRARRGVSGWPAGGLRGVLRASCAAALRATMLPSPLFVLYHAHDAGQEAHEGPRDPKADPQ